MKRRLSRTFSQNALTVEILRPESVHIHHRCHRGNCGHLAKFSVLREGKDVENLCRHHAAAVCKRNGLHLPVLPEV